mmetsp:Transcript_18190/g.45043  ORF Transcript_18190/g.45043 Transcript_18190/m.45043 type:complete len:96 (+) Transcript_18190:158-445(+)
MQSTHSTANDESHPNTSYCSWCRYILFIQAALKVMDLDWMNSRDGSVYKIRMGNKREINSIKDPPIWWIYREARRGTSRQATNQKHSAANMMMML